MSTTTTWFTPSSDLTLSLVRYVPFNYIKMFSDAPRNWTQLPGKETILPISERCCRCGECYWTRDTTEPIVSIDFDNNTFIRLDKPAHFGLYLFYFMYSANLEDGPPISLSPAEVKFDDSRDPTISKMYSFHTTSTNNRVHRSSYCFICANREGLFKSIDDHPNYALSDDETHVIKKIYKTNKNKY